MTKPAKPDGTPVPVRASMAALTVLLVVALVIATSPAAAVADRSEQDESAERRLSEARALAILDRAASAARSTAYAGVQRLGTWSPDGPRTMLVDVRHVPGAGTTVRSHGERRDSAGALVLPEALGSLALGDPTAGAAERLALLPDVLADTYRVQVASSGTVAGRAADVVAAFADGRPAARFWVDRDSGLVLRRELYDDDGRAVRSSAFVQLEVGEVARGEHLPPSLPPRWGKALQPSDLDALRAAGCTCPSALPDGLRLWDARRLPGDAGTGAGLAADAESASAVVHLTYTDGLSAISLFEQRGRIDHAALAGYEREQIGSATVWMLAGLPDRVVWSSGGRVFTILADAPPSTVREVVMALPNVGPRTGATDRIRRGLARLASWLNPFA